MSSPAAVVAAEEDLSFGKADLAADESRDTRESLLVDEEGLGAKAARGAALTITGQGLRVVLQFASLVVLARLLAPRDYGLVAEVVAIVGVGEIVRDFGLSAASVQAKSIDHRQRSNLFWINMSIGAALTVIVLAGAPLIADFYDTPRLTTITRVLSVTFLVNGMASQFRADLTRHLRFSRLALTDISAQALAFGIAVYVAARGQGYWALVVQQVGQAVLALGIVFILNGWRPGLPRRHVPMAQFWRFGWGLMGTQVLAYASRNVDSITIGNRFGATALGIYERAFAILMLPLNQINAPLTQVALPVLARLQDAKERFDSFVLRGQTVLLNVTVGVFAFAIAQAGPLFDIVLGPKWHSSILLFRILAIGGMFQAAGYPAYWIFLARGKTRANLTYNLVSRPIVVAGILVGAIWSPRGVAIGYVAALALIWPLQLWWVSRAADADGRQLFVAGLRSIVSYGAIAVVSALASRAVGLGDWPRLGVGTAAFIACIAVLWTVWPRFRGDLASLADSARLLRQR